MTFIKDLNFNMATVVGLVAALTTAALWAGEKISAVNQLKIDDAKMSRTIVKLESSAAGLSIRLGAMESTGMVTQNEISHINKTVGRIEDKLDFILNGTNHRHGPDTDTP